MANNIIKLNIGGTKVQTHKETLQKLSYFSSYFARWNSGEEIFIDADYSIFIHVLNLLRDPTYQYPIKYYDQIKQILTGFGEPNYINLVIKTENRTIQVIEPEPGPLIGKTNIKLISCHKILSFTITRRYPNIFTNIQVIDTNGCTILTTEGWKKSDRLILKKEYLEFLQNIRSMEIFVTLTLKFGCNLIEYLTIEYY